MARDNLFTRIELTSVHCHDEGDGPGSAEPYLWTVFFKIDGATISINPALTLSGHATVHTTPGSHGNLPNSDVDNGEVIPVPSAIGEWQTVLEPMIVPPPYADVTPDVGGVAGVVVVLMEEDNVTDDGAEAGHAALNAAVRAAIDQIVATRALTNQDISDDELAGFQEQVSEAATSAVRSQQNIFEDIWSWLNRDDTIGFRAFLFTHDDLAEQGTVDFSHRWRNEGDWEIAGSVTATRICPAEVLQEILDSALGGAGTDLDNLRRFRDDVVRKQPGLDSWWRTLQRNTPALALLLRRSPELRRSAAQVWQEFNLSIRDPDSPLQAGQLRRATALALKISQETGSRRLRIDAARAADLLPTVEGATVREGMASLAKLRVARRQRE